MTLIYELKRAYGRIRFYPKNREAVCICAVSAKAALFTDDLLTLEVGGFSIRVDHGQAENIEWRPRETP